MSVVFSSLPIVDLAPLCKPEGLSGSDRLILGNKLFHVFSTTGFAYLVNTPLTFKHADVFELALEFFNIPLDEKMRLAKKTFVPQNSNTYRGYFPVQPNDASDNLKEGFEIGPVQIPNQTACVDQATRFNLTESNVWPEAHIYASKARLESFYSELQELSATLLSLIATCLGKPANFFASYLTGSLSTLRMLHYPPRPAKLGNAKNDVIIDRLSSALSTPPPEIFDDVELSCTPHTDSGILTLLHQDPTGGLEVQDASGKWVPAPYVPESIVVNIGDLMAEVSGGRFVATMHRVRAPPATIAAPIGRYNEEEIRKHDEGDGSGEQSVRFGRFSVPFFFEPGEHCLVRSVDALDGDKGVLYGAHVRAKMESFVEYKHEDST